MLMHTEVGATRAVDWCGKTVFVTGATGFLGSHVVTSLLTAGADVRATTRRPQPQRDGLSWYQLDLADTAALCTAVDRAVPDVVVHLGGLVSGRVDPSLLMPTFTTHLASTVALLSMTQKGGIGRLVLAGSTDEPAPGAVPTSPYAAAKAGVSAYARLCADAFSAPVVTVRPADTFGPGQASDKLLPYVADCALRGVRPRLSSGRRRTDWVYVDDVVDGLLMAACRGARGADIDLGTGILRTSREVVERLLDALPTVITPVWGALGDRPAEPERAAAAARTEQILGWRAVVPLDEGLRRTADAARRRRTA